MKMIKKAACILLSIILVLPLAGCWNYRGLNDLSIVFGAAIDRNPDNGNIMITFEILDVTGSTDNSVKTLLIESEGATIFDAARNARNELSNKLYFGNMITVILSEEIAQNENLSGIIDWFLRDSECRETINIIISEGSTAGDILKTKGTDSHIIGQEIEEIVKEDNKTTSSTAYITLYEVYNILNGQGRSLILPLFNNTKSVEEDEIAKSNGVAIYEGERMIGSLSPTDTKNLLFVLGKVEGGVLTFSSNDDAQNDASLEISKNKTKLSYTYENGEIKFLVSTETDVFLDELWESIDALDEEKISELEKKAEESLQQGISTTIKKVQSEYDSDIFGFGNTIYKRDFKLWEQLKENWPQRYKTMEVEVKCKINIVNTAATMK